MSIYATLFSIIVPLPGVTPHIGGYHLKDGVIVMEGDATCHHPYHTDPDGFDHYVELFLQAVPPHIGHPSGYPSGYPEGDPYTSFLPPLAQVHLDNPNEPYGPPYRAVFICAPWTKKGTKQHGQKYINPLLMFTGEEYEAITFREMVGRINDALEEPKHRREWVTKKRQSGIRQLAI